MSNLKILKMGTEFVLEAISFTHSKNIEKSAPSIQWTITPEGGSAENIGTGKAIRYKISNKYAGKKVTFRAFIKEDSKKKFPQQCITCFIEEQVSVKGIRIKEVKGMKNAKAGDTVEFKVTEYNVDAKKITEAQKKQIKWDRKIEGEEKKVLTSWENDPLLGETIRFIIPQSWAGKNVMLMPYMNQSTESISTQIKIDEKFYYKGTKKWGKLQENNNSISGILKQKRQAYIAHDKAGTLGADTIDRLKLETEKELRLIYEGKGLLNLGTRDVLREDTANLMIGNFYNGKGKKISFDENTKISKDLVKNPTFKKYFDNYLKIIKEVLERYDIKTIDGAQIKKIFSDKGYRFIPDFSVLSEAYISRIREGKYEYYGLMGGTQTVTVDIEIEAESSSSYKVKTKMLIGDWYGSDWGDIYQGKSYEEIYSELGNQYSALGKILAGDQISQNAHAQVQLQKKKYVKGYLPSLNAFFMLQHFYGTHHKYVPFETEIIFVSENTIFIEKNK